MQRNLIITLVLAIVFSCCSTPKNTAVVSAELKNALNNRTFTFEAQQVVPRDYRISQLFPNAGQIYHLNAGYEVKVRPDTLDVHLPFYGRAYQAPMDPTKGGIKFTSTDFDIKAGKDRKGNTELTFLPRDSREVQQMFLTVSASGYATLNIISYQKETINFYGIVQPK